MGKDQIFISLGLAFLVHALFGYWLIFQKESQTKPRLSNKVEISIQNRPKPLLPISPPINPKDIPVLPTPPITPPQVPQVPKVPKPAPIKPPRPKRAPPATKKSEAPPKSSGGEKPAVPNPKPAEPPPAPKGEEGKKPGNPEVPTNPNQPGTGEKGEGGGQKDGQGSQGSADGTPGGKGGGKGGTGTGEGGKGEGKGPYSDEDEVKEIPSHDAEECGQTMKVAWTQSDANAEGQEGDVILQVLVKEDGRVGQVTLVRTFSKKAYEIALGNIRFNPKCRFSPAIDHQGKKVSFLIKRYKVRFERNN